MNDERLVYTVEEVARRLGLGRSATYDAIRRGQIPARRIGRRILIPRAELERWLGGRESD